MSGSLSLATLDGRERALTASVLSNFRSRLRGSAIARGAPDYDERRTIWNAMIDLKPGLIVRCAGPDDVVAAVNFAREHGLLTSVRSGGHNIAGTALVEGGLTIDLSAMNSVDVDAAKRIARVDAGALLADVDKATQAHGLVVPLGINSTTGVAGLTLGGGFGWLSRSLGLTIDCLKSVEIVTADGKRRHADANESADLFWAVRGGGGNFGVVTSFEFQLREAGPEVYAGLVVHGQEHGRELLRSYRGLAAKLPDRATCWCVLRKAPPLPFLPESIHGKHVLIFALCYAGRPDEAEKVFAELRSLGKPVGSHVGVMPYVGWQQAFDPLLTAGARNYWKSHNFAELSDGAIEAVLKFAATVPSGETEIIIAQLGGAVNRVDAASTAYPHRDVEYIINVHGRWRDKADDVRAADWARKFYGALQPFATGGVYVNFMPEDEAERPVGPYGSNAARLAAIKRTYDPSNFFRVNRNVVPSAEDAPRQVGQ